MEEESDVPDAPHGSAPDVADAPDLADAADAADLADAADPDAPDPVSGVEAEDDGWASGEWDAEGSEGSGWFADPDVEGQERYFDGSEWTSETRAVDPGLPLNHLPEHTGELQRALAAATADIDDVEDRLGTLFDRAEQRGQRGGRAREQVAADSAARAAQGRALADSVSQGGGGVDDDEEWLVEDEAEDGPGDGSGDGLESAAGGFGAGDDDDDSLPELDEDLASEEPEQVKKGLFRRRG